MSSLRRVLKFTPAVLLGLLVLAWMLSLRGMVTQYFQLGRYGGAVSVYNGNASCFFVSCDHYAKGRRIEDDAGYVPPPKLGIRSVFGRFYFDSNDETWIWSYGAQVPSIVLVTVMLPLVLGSFTRFQFRLWHYLAYTALVSVQLAYYLQWQG